VVLTVLVLVGAVLGGRAIFAGDLRGVVAPGGGLVRGCWESGQLAASSINESGKTARLLQWTAPPRMTIDPARRYAATLETSAGEIEVELRPDLAPLAVNNFVCLAWAGHYDETVFHRVIPEAIVQGGDPSGTGAGGPGYRFPDETIVGDYRPGTLAMANSGPNTNGSQFFIVADDLSGRLPPRYTIFGQVTRGQLVVEAIAAAPLAAGAAGDDFAPRDPVKVERVLISEG
jgi:cyclophilin family peptidyl-prolyl cis-trans isomerase